MLQTRRGDGRGDGEVTVDRSSDHGARVFSSQQPVAIDHRIDPNISMDLRVSDENTEVYHAVGFPQIEYDPVLDDHIPDKLTHNSVQSDNTFNVANIQPCVARCSYPSPKPRTLWMPLRKGC